jgi:hypothetical protein
MFEKKKLDQIVDSGITFLESQQEAGGNFLSLSFTQSAGSIGVKQYHSLFFTTLILGVLVDVEDAPRVKKIKEKAASFILSQKSEHWSFNYWMRNSREAKKMPYPDDLDDTFCALASLFQYNPHLIDGKSMADIVQLLTTNESEEGGPYRTWLVPPESGKKWRDVDIAVNSNIAYFLSLHGIDLPQLTSFIESHIKREVFISPYYPSVYPVIYFISRFYKGKYIDQLIAYLLEKRDKNYTWGNPLNTALAVSSLLDFGVDPNALSESIRSLIKSQKNDSWEPYAFCIDPAREGNSYYAGSSALTTAFCLEAIMKYRQASADHHIDERMAEEERVYEQVIKKVEDTCSVYDGEFRTRASSSIQALLGRKEGRQIPLMAFYFARTLGDKRKNISDELLIQLGAANVLGWIAYTIYDDFLDDEGDPALLSIANVSSRELTLIFESIFSTNNEFRAFFHTIMGRLDEANLWEVTHCRMKIVDGKVMKKFVIPNYGKYEKLACKSLGHGLGPIAVLFSLGYKWNSPEVTYIVNFFEHYLIAKQLNDDAHDWENDLRKGHINPVVVRLLKKIYLSKLKTENEIDIISMLPQLQEIFWNEIIDEVCKQIFDHTKKARMILKKCEIIVDPSYLEEILVVYENVAYKVLRERERAVQFVSAYSVDRSKKVSNESI